jgi:histidinol-phosphate aminotransferase
MATRQEEAAVKPDRSMALERYVFDLSSTEWDVPPAGDVISATVFAARGSVNKHPDPAATKVRRLLAERHGLRMQQIVLGNGAGDLLQTAARTLLSRDDELVTAWPSYPLYPRMATAVGAHPVPVALDNGHVDPEAVLAAVGPRTRAVVICNPNDPTGTYLDSPSVAELLSRLPAQVHVLLDEALVHFQDREEEDACLQLVNEFPKLLVFRSFSNAYALSGLRAGYAVGSAEVASLLESLAPVLGVNCVTQAAVQSVLRQGDADLRRRRELVIAERNRVSSEIASLHFDCPPSQAHFVWLHAREMSGLEFAEALQRAGVVVFPGSALGDGNHVRATLTSVAGTDRLLAVLKEISASSNDQRPADGLARPRSTLVVGADLQASAA